MGNIPEGHVEVEVIIKDNGTYETKIIGHGPNASCLHEDDDKILQGLEGGIGEASDYGHTNEYYQETAPKIRPQPATSQDEGGFRSPFDGPGKKQKSKRVDMGFGV